MANKTINMDSLKEIAVHIHTGMVSVFPNEATESRLDLSEIKKEFNGCYSLQSPTISFIHNSEMYAIPYTDRVVRSLEVAGLKRANFYVPFSQGDYPKNETSKWVYLKEMVVQSYIEDLMEDCIEYSDKNGIGELDEETLANCMELPFMGIAVEGVGYETCYYPMLNIGRGAEEIARYVGKYNIESETVMFVYRNGKTYLTRGYGILRKLKHAGYTEKNILVPLAHGERIKDKELQKRWETIRKLVR